jgi:putative NADH-flavin reductase
VRLTVFGGTGHVGRQLLGQALQEGHEVTALARDPDRLPMRDRLRPVRGDVRDPVAVRQAIAGGDAVLSALGQRGFRKVTVCADGMRTILPAMSDLGVSRLIAVSGYGVAGSRGNLYSAIAWISIRSIMRDKEAMEELIRHSTAEWTIARPAILTNGGLAAAYQTGTDLRLTPASRISCADVAHFMLRALSDDGSVRHALAIGP